MMTAEVSLCPQNGQGRMYTANQQVKWLAYMAKTYFPPSEISVGGLSGRTLFKLTIQSENSTNFILLAQLLNNQPEVESVTITRLRMKKTHVKLHIRTDL